MNYQIDESFMDNMLNPTSGFAPWPKGVYDFETIDAELVKTKSPPPREQLVLKLKVFDGHGKSQTVYHYVALYADWGIENLSEYYTATGGLPADPLNVDAQALKMRSGKVALKIEESIQYGDRNKVAYFPAPKAGDVNRSPRIDAALKIPKQQLQPANDQTIPEDDIPF
jgi:hypothetical protein